MCKSCDKVENLRRLIKQYRESLKTKDLKPSAINTYHTCLSANEQMLRWHLLPTTYHIPNDIPNLRKKVI